MKKNDADKTCNVEGVHVKKRRRKFSPPPMLPPTLVSEIYTRIPDLYL